METKKNKAKYACELCDFYTSYKQNYNKHLATAKHRRVLFGNKKVFSEFYCDVCDYNAVTKQNYNKHISTELHLETKKYSHLICNFCNKQYKTRAGLWKHKKTCKLKLSSCKNNSDNNKEEEDKEMMIIKNELERQKNNELNLGKSDSTITQLQVDKYKNIEKENDELRNMIKTLCNQNSSLMNRMSEQNQTIKDMVPKIGNQINTTHQNLNVQIFLNEHCKDAINIKDFVESLKIGVHDIEYTKINGISESVGNILANGLEKLDIYKRPIHCTNPELKTLYIKDENNWEKNNEKVVTETISDVKNKHIEAVQKWEKENPEWLKDKVKTKQFIKMIDETTAAIEKEDEKKIINKIVKKVEVK